MAEASNLGVKIFEQRIPVQQETLEICKFFRIDPLQLISSGTLLISAKPEYAEKIVKNLEQTHILASVIGEFLEDPCTRVIIRKNGEPQTLPKPSSDHLWVALMRGEGR